MGHSEPFIATIELVKDWSRPERLVVMLRYAERLTVAETAAVLGMSAGRVRAIEAGVIERVRRRRVK